MYIQVWMWELKATSFPPLLLPSLKQHVHLEEHCKRLFSLILYFFCLILLLAHFFSRLILHSDTLFMSQPSVGNVRVNEHTHDYWILVTTFTALIITTPDGNPSEIFCLHLCGNLRLLFCTLTHALTTSSSCAMIKRCYHPTRTPINSCIKRRRLGLCYICSGSARHELGRWDDRLPEQKDAKIHISPFCMTQVIWWTPGPVRWYRHRLPALTEEVPTNTEVGDYLLGMDRNSNRSYYQWGSM